MNHREWEELVPAFRIALVCVFAISAVGGFATACPNEKSAKLHAYVPIDNGGETIRQVSRGAKLAIACDGVDVASAGNDVRVVLNFSESSGKKLGYKGVLATDQSRADGKLQIRVPDAPDLANHTLNVKVFMVTGDSAKMCDAGKVRVV
jgi:hypothetical protein